MPKTILDSYDEFNFMVVILFIVFVCLIFLVIILKNRSGSNRYPHTTYNNYIVSNNTSNIPQITPQTTPYQYNYSAQLNQYNLPTQEFY